MISSEIKKNFKSVLLPFWNEKGTPLPFKGEDNVSIHTRIFRQPKPSQNIVIITGRAECSMKYTETIYDLYQLGYSVAIMDHRGQGFSERLLEDKQIGYVKDFNDFILDFAKFVTVLKQNKFETDFLIAHSMGGAVSVLTLSQPQYQNLFKKVVLSPPMLLIYTDPFPFWFAYGFCALQSLLGKGKKYALGQYDCHPNAAFEENDVTFCKERFWMTQEIQRLFPESTLGGVSNQWVKESDEADIKILFSDTKIPVPLLVFEALEDRVVRPVGLNIFLAKNPHAQKVALKNAQHEIFMETDAVRNKVLSEIDAFFKAPLPADS